MPVKGNSPVIAGHGQIARMILPEGWVEEDAGAGGYGAKSLRKFHPSEFADASLCLYYRGGPITDNSAALFSDLLRQPVHVLSEYEYDSLWEVLENASSAKAFKAEVAETVDLNGRCLLSVAGLWLSSERRSQLLMLDADGTGKFVQEVYYSAPVTEFAAYLPLALAAFQSIEWL